MTTNHTIYFLILKVTFQNVPSKNPSKKRQRAKSCAELIEDVEENELPDHEKADAEVTAKELYHHKLQLL
ncbi:MAG: hypothetical protein ABSC20_11155 [Candidatus Bathyarchaeia archaeon]|jgi:hypothetical protein